MRLSPRFRLARHGAVLLGTLVLLAGCGGDEGASTGGSGGEGEGERSSTYIAAFQLCEPGVKAVSADYAIAATEKAVITVVVEQVAGGLPKDEEEARMGCRDALRGEGGTTGSSGETTETGG